MEDGLRRTKETAAAVAFANRDDRRRVRTGGMPRAATCGAMRYCALCRRRGMQSEAMKGSLSSVRKKYRQAAVGYFVYGVVYLAGAIYMAVAGISERAAADGSVLWFVLGAVMVAAFPLMVWFQFKWVTRALALLVFVRVGALSRMFAEGAWYQVPFPGGAEVSAAYGAALFLVISLMAALLLVRAGWAEWWAKRRGSGT